MRLADLAPVIAATWPAKCHHAAGPFTVPDGAGGGNRVSAARLTDPSSSDASEDEIDAALALLDQVRQPPLFAVLNHQAGLDSRLAARGFGIRDVTLGLTMPCAELAARPPPVSCFSTWPPLAIQEEIWAQGGIGPARLAVMDRASGAKTTLFGRIKDRLAGTAYVGIRGQTAMLHALEVLPSARRSGLASIMMGAAGDWALAEGATLFSVLVTRANLPAQALYASLGFKPVGHYYYRSPTA